MIQTTEVSITYKGDGVQSSFPYPYPYRNSDDIVGYIINDVGYEKRITNNFKYDKVSNIYQYPLAGDPLAAPYSIKLIRETPQQQNADLPGKLPFSLIEKSLDWIIMILQEIGSRCNSLWHIRNDCKLSETNARNSASAAAESEENAANSEDMAKKWAMSPVSPDGVVDPSSPTGYTQSAKVWAEEAKGYRDIAIAGQMQADWNEENTESKAFIKGKPELNFIPQSYTNFTDYSKMSIISRESHLENVPPSTYAHINSIRECLAKGKVDLSSYTHHTVIDDVRLSGEEAVLYINKESGWSGANKFNHIFSYTAKYPFTLYGNNVTDTFLTESTFETFRQGVRTNAPLTIQRCYFGDNGNFDVDSANPDCAILAKSKADIKVYNSTIGISCRKGLDSTCIIKFDSTENEPATVYLKDCELGVANQNLEDRNGGAIADLSNKNDRLIIDNCTFTVTNRVNNNHTVMPYMLKPFKTVWSYNPFKSYLIGGKMLDVASFTPSYPNMPENLYPTILETENSLKNPFGGNLLKVVDNFYLTYHVPKELVGTVMYAHIYIYDYEGSNPTFSYIGSDGTDPSGKNYKWFSKGNGELSKRTPYLNVFPFIPTKEKGKFAFHNSSDTYTILAGAALVQDINKNKLCDYEEAYQE